MSHTIHASEASTKKHAAEDQCEKVADGFHDLCGDLSKPKVADFCFVTPDFLSGELPTLHQ